MKDIKSKVEELSLRLTKLKEGLNLPKKKERLEILSAEAGAPNLWGDPEKAKKTLQELSSLTKELEEVDQLTATVAAISDLAEAARAEKDIEKLELVSFLTDEYDKKNAIMAVHAGQGGTEAMDWANMLLRMYLRFCEKRGWKTVTLDLSQGEEAGVKSATFKVEGQYAYGYLKNEAGTHRLVRQSPFNADKLRQTSFALVEVLPELSEVDLPNIVVPEEDLDWQFFRASSQGGQNVQKVSTAVRLTHKPTGIVVTAQNERFQEQNRKNALDLLRAKLWLREKEEQKKTKKELKGEYRPASWGTQIRSYVLHPYKMVKDLRTEVETSNTEAVLDGEIDEFIEANLKLKPQGS
ncbi:MAG: Peptide chain release factor 2 [Candidatus Woesebacteria bacterium GW2011_GWE1_45_18]|uniref:Peptide chain release factor 2 n=1 Tax=Candidatus Woesebacteria bacterium GW2011_GWE1_45_18 TaxID=1618598 RepID=A0A0G1PDQ3_9BACT|nr:MAG: Peptide chain release factor 2 [Candidatus Woesebacteria bacterium GW2011_GWE1_45_18]